MQLILDAIVARCPSCGHRDFSNPPRPLPVGSPLTCARCGAKVSYTDLSEQAKNAPGDYLSGNE
jgi:DNA-directed RNA polymerase subunit RPC12/RpoP